MAEQGEGADQVLGEECDAAVKTAARIDQEARRAVEAEGHALFKAGRLDEAAEANLRARLMSACAGLESEVEVSMLTVRSPTGRYEDNPAVKAYWEPVE